MHFFARRRHSVDKGWPNLRCQIIKTPLPSLQLLLHTGIMIKSDQGRDGPHIARSSKANGVKKQKNSIVKKERKPLKTTYPIHNAPLWSELPVRSTFNGIISILKRRAAAGHIWSSSTLNYPAQQPLFSNTSLAG